MAHGPLSRRGIGAVDCRYRGGGAARMNTNARGNANRLKTRKHLESDGWQVQYLEVQYRIVTKTGRVVPVKRDLWGGDLVATNGERVRWIQVKSNEKHIADGLKELARCPLPDFVEKELWLWRFRAREPEIIPLLKEASDEGTRVPTE